MLGWRYDADPVIQPVPEPDLARIASYDPAADISKAMENSGFASMIARHIIGKADNLGPYALLAILFIITNIFTELITNNAAAALSFPIALSVATQ